MAFTRPDTATSDMINHLKAMPLVDPAAIAALADMMDEESQHKVISQLIMDIKTNHQTIQEALVTQDIKTLAAAAHRFKTLAGTFGLPAIAAAAHHADDAGRQDDQAAIYFLVQWMESQLPEAVIFFKGHLDRLSSDTDMK